MHAVPLFLVAANHAGGQCSPNAIYKTIQRLGWGLPGSQFLTGKARIPRTGARDADRDQDENCPILSYTLTLL